MDITFNKFTFISLYWYISLYFERTNRKGACMGPCEVSVENRKLTKKCYSEIVINKWIKIIWIIKNLLKSSDKQITTWQALGISIRIDHMSISNTSRFESFQLLSSRKNKTQHRIENWPERLLWNHLNLTEWIKHSSELKETCSVPSVKTNNRLEEAGDFESRAYVRTSRVNVLNLISIELLLCCYSEMNEN